MKKHIIYWMLFLLSIFSFGQNEKQESNVLSATPLLTTSKQSLLKDVDVIFNTRMAYDSYFLDGNHTKSLFSANQFRLEIKGKIHEKVFFRFRNRYTKIADPSTIDNLSRTVDMAYLVFDVTPQAKFTFGKMIANWGGYELLLNPIEILSYNAINNSGDFFLTGAAFSYALADKKNTLGVQVLNSRTKTFEEQYSTNLPSGISESTMPLAVVGNWKGSLFDGKLETTYSYSHITEAQNTMINYVSLGNKLKMNKLTVLYDFQYSKEDLDHKGIVSSIIKNKYIVAAEDVTYLENWMRAEYQVRLDLTLLLTLMNSNAYWDGNLDLNKESKLLSTYGLIPTVEYAPFSDINLKFYVGYVAKKNNYSGYAKNAFDSVDTTTGQFSFGIIAPLLVL